jgi:predicted O-methyltransferase YrrM
MITQKLFRFLRGGAVIGDNFFLAFITDRPRRVRFVNSVLGFAEHERLKDRFPTEQLPRVLEQTERLDIVLSHLSHEPGNVAFAELCTLASLARARSARRVFEIGTFDGNTSYHLALNTPDDSQVFTIDIPPGSAPALKADAGDPLFREGKRPEYRWRGSAVADKIHPILADSARFDVAPYRQSMDMVFIDGAHSAEYIMNDTALALEMIRPGGIVVWHDYLVWNDVTSFLQKFCRDHQLSHLAGTSLVVYQAPASQ